MEFITKINHTIEDHPLILLDVSGSTTIPMNNNGSENVLYYECKHVSQFLTKYNIQIVDIILWSTEAKLLDHSIAVKNIYDFIVDVDVKHENTTLTSALKLIPNNKYKDIIIVTDGQIHDETKMIVDQVKTLFLSNDKLLNLYIISVEANDKDFMKMSSDVGTEIYNILNQNFLTNYVRYFIRFNNRYSDEPFVNLYNPILNDNYIPFGDEQFHIKDHELFLTYVKNKIMNVNCNIDKIIYDLSFTIKYMLKTTQSDNKSKLIERYADLLYVLDNKEYVSHLLELVRLHQLGFTTTFESYVDKRTELFTHANNSLQSDTIKALSYLPHNEFMTIPVMTDQGIKIFVSNKFADIYMKNNKFSKGGIQIGNAIIPILPMVNVFDHFTNQCIRIWMRLLYAQQFDCNVNSDLIMYGFLGIVIKVVMSELPNEIKTMYQKLGTVLFDRNRFGSNGLTENEFLKSNKPKSVSSESIDIETILTHAAKINQFDINPMIYWYACVCALGNETIRTKQLEYCKDIINSNGYNVDTFFDDFKKKYHFNITLYNCIENEQILPVVDKNYNILMLTPQYELHKLYTLDEVVPINLYRTTEYFTVSKKLTQFVLNIRNSKKFKEAINTTKYHFINDIDLSNIIIAGGFCRSIIYDQEIQDIDFFLYGLAKEQYIVRAKKLIIDLIEKIKQENLTILYLNKKDSHVLELLCVKCNNNNAINTMNDVELNKNDMIKQYKFQIILRSSDIITDVFNNFDIDACNICYDGQNVLLNERGLFAYTYGLSKLNFNDLRIDEYRIVKYFDYGFNYIIDSTNINKIITDFKTHNIRLVDYCSDETNLSCSSMRVIETNATKTTYETKLYKNARQRVYNGMNIDSIALVLEYCKQNKDVTIQLYEADKLEVEFTEQN